MNIAPTISIPIKNFYILLAVGGTFLYVFGQQYAQKSLHEHNAGWIDRTVQYQQLDKVSDRAERKQKWHILRARDNLASDELKTAFINYMQMAVLSILLMSIGYGVWKFTIQPLEDKLRHAKLAALKTAELKDRRKIQMYDRKLEAAQWMPKQEDSQKRSVWTKLTRLFYGK